MYTDYFVRPSFDPLQQLARWASIAPRSTCLPIARVVCWLAGLALRNMRPDMDTQMDSVQVGYLPLKS